jgi:hypothetical protein
MHPRARRRASCRAAADGVGGAGGTDDTTGPRGVDRWLIDSGLEPDLIFHQGNELPDFAAFTLLGDPSGEELLRRYFRDHVRIAAASGRDVVLETRPGVRARTGGGAWATP